MKVRVIDGDRKREIFSNPVINYKLAIYLNSRCLGFVSEQKYKNIDSAYKAKTRVEKILKDIYV